MRLFIVVVVVVVVKIDAFAEKNNLTEAANVGKEFLLGMSKKGTVVGGAHNETEMKSLAVPSHPLLERLQNIKVRRISFIFKLLSNNRLALCLPALLT